MTTVDQLFAQAVRAHQQNDLGSAELLYRQILSSDPAHADALHLLGFLEHQRGRSELAVPLIRQAISLRPTAAACHSNLGIVLMDEGLLADAVESFQRAVGLNPSFADACANLALALQKLGHLDEAAATCRRTLEIDSRHVTALNLLGNILKQKRQIAGAVECYREALRIDPRFVDAQSNLGIALRAAERLPEAADCFRQVIALAPHHVQAHYNLGCIYQHQGQLADAVEHYRQTVRLNPKHADAHNNLGNVQKDMGQLPEAAQCYRRAIELNSQDVGAHYNLAIVLQDLGHLDEAATHFDEALRLNPKDPVARYNRSFLLLLTGDFTTGWPEYEYRWQEAGIQPRSFAEPRWRGEPLEGKTILLHAEQGLGDAIQFCRYASLVKQRGATVVLECLTPLANLLDTMPGVDRVVAQGQPLPAFDFQIPLLSLPAVFETTLKNIPATIPYLTARPELVDHWRNKLAPLDGCKIGIAWQGNPLHKNDRFRSAPLGAFGPLAQVTGVNLVSLQKGPGTEQLSQTTEFTVHDLGECYHSATTLLETSAVLRNLDLVVTIDSALTHLAGALGVPVWVALPANPDWRWLLERADSPWYPTMRLFRQSTLGDWTDVFARMANELRELTRSARL